MPEPTPRLGIAVVADLAPGAGPTAPRPIDRQRFDEVLAALAPRLELEVPDALADGPPRRVSLRFEAWRDFSPAGLVEQVPELGRARELLARLARGGEDAEALARDAAGVAPPAWIESLRGGAAEAGAEPAPPPAARPADAGSGTEGAGVDAILDLVDAGDGSHAAGSPERETARRLVDGLTSRPARTGRAGERPPAGAAEELQGRLGAQLDAILAAPAFRALERAWAGLRWLVVRTDFREDIDMAVLAAPAEAAADAVASLADEGDANVVLAAYEHDASARDFDRVQALGRAGEAIQTVVVTGLAPEFFGCGSWAELGRGESPRARFAGDAYAAWHSLREREASRWLVLVANRLAVRGRYAPDEESTRGVPFAEAPPGGLLASGAWAVAAVLARSWARSRACVQISGTRNGLVPDLPLLALGDRPVPVEGTFGNERREDLEACGVTALQHYQRDVAFLGAVRTFRAPEKFPDAEATADSAQQVTLAYQILASRLVKLLGRVVPEMVGTARDEATATLREAVVAHFSRPGKPLAPDHVGVELRDHEDDPTLTAVGLRVLPEVQIGGRPVNVLLDFALRL